MNNNYFISAQKIRKNYDVSPSALRSWADDGKISCVRLPKGKRLYNKIDIDKLFGDTSLQSREKICYARVSSSHQKEDLERQIEYLKELYPDHSIVSDIGSGLNWKRKGFTSLLERVYSGNVEEIVVAYKDRLCRFGFELVEWFFKKADTKLLVLNGSSNTEDHTSELAEDLLSITTVFVARNNGLRSAKNKQNRRNKEDKIVS